MRLVAEACLYVRLDFHGGLLRVRWLSLGSGDRFDRLTFHRHAFSLLADIDSADLLAGTRRTTSELPEPHTPPDALAPCGGVAAGGGYSERSRSGEGLVGQAWVQTVCAAVARTEALAG
jgi:hypothetical protein